MDTKRLWTDEDIALQVGIVNVQFIEEGISYEVIDAVNEIMQEMRDSYEARLAELQQQDKDWLAMLRAIAKLADKMEASKAEPDNKWCDADDATLLEQFDPWQTLREVEAGLRAAQGVSEVVPDESLRRILKFVRGHDVFAHLGYEANEVERWLKAQRPVAGQEEEQGE